jgi:hypothetical protein
MSKIKYSKKIYIFPSHILFLWIFFENFNIPTNNITSVKVVKIQWLTTYSHKCKKKSSHGIVTKWTLYIDWQDILFASPIVQARTNAIFKVTKVINILTMTIFPTILRWSLWRCGHLHKLAIFFLFWKEYQQLYWWAQMQFNQFLAVVTQMKHLFFFFHIMQKKICTRYMYLISWMKFNNLCNFAWILII